MRKDQIGRHVCRLTYIKMGRLNEKGKKRKRKEKGERKYNEKRSNWKTRMQTHKCKNGAND